MAGLWVPPDDVHRGAGAAEPAVRVRVAGLVGRDDLPGRRRRRHLLLLQPHLPRAGAPRAAGPTSTPLQGHGHRHTRSWMGALLHRADPVPGMLRGSRRVHSPCRSEHEGNLPDRCPWRHHQAVRVRGHLRRLPHDPGAAAVLPLPPPRQPHLRLPLPRLQPLRRRRLRLPRELRQGTSQGLLNPWRHQHPRVRRVQRHRRHRHLLRKRHHPGDTGDGGGAGDGQDVQGPLPVLRGAGCHLLQRGHRGVLGVRKRGAGPSSLQLHGGREGHHPGVAPAHYAALHAYTALGHDRGVPAADQRPPGGLLLGPQGWAVRRAECLAAAAVPHRGCRLCRHDRGDGAILRRHERAHRCLRIPAARLRRAGRVLQPYVQAVQEGGCVLAQHGHSRCVLRDRSGRIRRCRQADRAGRWHLQTLRQRVRVMTYEASRTRGAPIHPLQLRIVLRVCQDFVGKCYSADPHKYRVHIEFSVDKWCRQMR